MVPIGDAARAIELARALLQRGYFVPVAFFPVVPRGEAQLRVVVTAGHSRVQLTGLADAIAANLASP